MGIKYYDYYGYYHDLTEEMIRNGNKTRLYAAVRTEAIPANSLYWFLKVLDLTRSGVSSMMNRVSEAVLLESCSI